SRYPVALPSFPTRRSSDLSAWLLWLQWFCYFYGFYFYLTWLPTYLQEGRGIAVKRSVLLASLPLFTAGAGSLFSGAMSTWFACRSEEHTSELQSPCNLVCR